MYDAAIEFVECALAAERSQVPLRVLEQYHAYRMRRAAHRVRATQDAGERATFVADMRRALGDLEAMAAVGSPTRTVERLCLVGEGYKHLALVQTAMGRGRALEQMRDAYRDATGLARERRGRVDPYAANQWVAAQLALKPKLTDDVRRDALNLLAESQAVAGVEESFRVESIKLEARLLGMLLQGHGGNSARGAARAAERLRMERDLVERFQASLTRGASPFERAATIAELEFLSEASPDCVGVVQSLRAVLEPAGM